VIRFFCRLALALVAEKLREWIEPCRTVTLMVDGCCYSVRVPPMNPGRVALFVAARLRDAMPGYEISVDGNHISFYRLR
jgi:hypothetical protein